MKTDSFVEEGKSKIHVSEDGLFTYRLDLQDDTAMLVTYQGAYLDEDKKIRNLVIPETIDGHKVGCIDEAVFSMDEYLETITLPAGLKELRQGFILGIVFCETLLLCSGSYVAGLLLNAVCRLVFTKNALKLVGIKNLAGRKVGQLSGGQKQRVAIARALANNPNVILADEPTGALDSRTSAEIVSLLMELNRQGKTVIIVTHDLSIAEKCGRVVRLADGVVQQ